MNIATNVVGSCLYSSVYPLSNMFVL